MKKIKIFSVVLTCLILLSFIFLAVIKNEKTDDILLLQLHQFEKELKNETMQDEDKVVIVSKNNSSIYEISDKLGIETEKVAEGYSFSNEQQNVETQKTIITSLGENLDYKSLKEFCKELGYVVYDDGENYQIYSQFSLQRLIVFGNLNQSYGASKVISGYKNYNILCYDTEQQTKNNYNLLKSKGYDVYVDSYVFEQSDNAFEFATSYKSWGAGAIQVDGYRDYLNTNGTNKDVVVAVIDSGINTSHEMFADRILTDADGDYVGHSYVTTTYNYSGYSFEDDRGHGTHVSGIVCDLTPSNVKILPLKVFTNAGKGSTTNILAAVEKVYEEYSNTYNVSCINMSLGGGYSEVEYNDYNTLFKNLRDEKNILTVVAAGNEADLTDNYIPAACEEALVVSALKQENGTVVFEEEYSNYGSHVDVSAPGSEVYSAYIANSNKSGASEYDSLSGTSMAAPHAAAVVALLCCDSAYYTGTNPSYDIDLIEQAVIKNAVDNGEVGFDNLYGHGMLNLYYFEAEKTDAQISFYSGATAIHETTSYYEFDSSLELEITCSDSNLTIYYTTDGSLPTTSSNVYTDKLQISTTCTVYAVACKVSGGSIVKASELFKVNLFMAGLPIDDYFEISSGGILISYTGHFKNLVIPSIIDGVQVRSIDIYLFYNSELVSVELPTTVKTISGYVFQNCLNLERVIAPGVTKTYIAAFANCPKIEKLTSEPVETSEKAAYFPNLKESISHAFMYCTGLKFVELNNLTTPGEVMFAGCSNLLICNLPKITNIPTQMFFSCKSLKHFEIGEYVSTIGEAAFMGTEGIVLTLDSQNPYLYSDGRAIYDNNAALFYFSSFGLEYEVRKTVTIGGVTSNITTINDSAFYGMNVSKFILHENIVNIGKFAFGSSSVGTFVYKAKEAVADGYMIPYEDGSWAVASPFSSTNIQNLIFESTVNSIPQSICLYGGYMNNIYIKSFNTTFGTHSLYSDGCDYLYFDFDESVTTSFLNRISTSSVHYGYPVVFSKTQLSNVFYLSYKQMGRTAGYYFYSNADCKNYQVIEFESQDSVFHYDGTAHNIAISVDESVSNYTITYGLSTDEYNITDISTNNHFIDQTNNQVVYFKISADGYFDAFGSALLSIEMPQEKIAITITLEDQTFCYGDSISLNNQAFSVNLNVDISDVVLSMFVRESDFKNVGTYTLSANIVEESHFIITIIDAKLYIEQRPIKIKPKTQTAVYGQMVVLVHQYDILSGSLVAGDDLGAFFSVSAKQGDNAGFYVISLNSYSNTNYDVDFVTGTFEIKKRKLVVEIDNIQKIYGEYFDLDMVQWKITEGEVYELSEPQIELYISEEIKNAKDYEINLSFNNQNYEIFYNNAKLTISKRSLKIKIKNKSIVYGDDLNFTNTSYEILEGDAAYEDVLEFSYLTNASAKLIVGEYELSAQNLNANYDITFESGKLEVTPRELEITILDKTVVYGNKPNLSTNVYVISKGSVVFGDQLNVEVDCDVTVLSEVGIYDISATCKDSNYAITIVDGKLTINPRVIVISLLSQKIEKKKTLTIDQEAYEISVGTVVEGDDLGVSILFDSEENDFEIGQKYALKGESSNKNYEVHFVTAHAEIIKEDKGIVINQYLIYAVLGLIAVFAVSVIAFRRRKHDVR